MRGQKKYAGGDQATNSIHDDSRTRHGEEGSDERVLLRFGVQQQRGRHCPLQP